MRKSFPSILNVGLASILTVFLVIALATFATLSLVTSRLASQRAQQYAQRAALFGEASADAEEKLAEIDRILYGIYYELPAPDEDIYFMTAQKELALHSHLAAERTEQGLSVIFDIPMTDTQHLHIELMAEFPEKSKDSFYRILQWSITPTDAWSADETLPVFGNDN